MIDQLTIQAVEDAFDCGYPRDAAAALLIELDGLEAGLDDAGRARGRSLPRLRAPATCGGARRGRARAALEGPQVGVRRLRPLAPAYMVMDGVIPRTKLPYVLRRVERDRRPPHGLRVGNVFHAGDGNLHPNILYDPRKPGEEARVLAAGAEILRVCAEVGGTISGEHGIGLEKTDYMPFIFSEADLACMQRREGRVQSHRPLQSGQDLPDAEACVEVGPSPTGRIRSKRRGSPSASSAAVGAPRARRLLDKLRRSSAPPTC